MAEDDRAVMERLAELEAEVKADADAQRARKDAALAKLRAQKAEQAAERQAERDRSAASSGRMAIARTTKKSSEPDRDRDADHDSGDLGDLGGALELAGRANRVKNELQKTPGAGEKSWVKSGLASLFLGPFGWLYAGSFREAVPASAGALVLAATIGKIIPMILLMPVMMVAFPLSGIAGVVYALQYNRKGSRQRLFGDDKKKQLPPGK